VSLALTGPGSARSCGQPRSEEELPPKPAQHRLYYNNLLALRYNPLGAFEEFRFSYRYRLIDSDSRLLR
jgi:hypothetical protein